MQALVRTILLAALSTFAATAATAEETECRGAIGAQSLDNLRVPDGASCRLKGTRFNGNPVIGRGGTLTAEDIMVNGSVQAEGHQSVALGGSSRVGGSVQLKQGGAVRLAGIHVASDVQLDANWGSHRCGRCDGGLEHADRGQQRWRAADSQPHRAGAGMQGKFAASDRRRQRGR